MKHNTEKGFTLVELLIAMSLFAILIAIAASGFVRAIRTQRAIVALMEANDNMSSALEQMSREVRTGFNFTALAGGTGVKFTNGLGQDVSYYWNEGALKREVGSGGGSKITADNIEVKGFSVLMCGRNLDGSIIDKCGGASSDFPPRLTIDLSVSPKNTYFENFSLDIQTTISGRNISS